MKTFRDYETLIRDKVKEINDKDPNWKWSVKSFGKYLVRIRWSYLDYCEEKDNCFFLTLDHPVDEFEDQYLACRSPQNGMIDGHFVSEEHKQSWQESWENAIVSSIEAIADYAHSRY